jgi:hypothetical protein
MLVEQPGVMFIPGTVIIGEKAKLVAAGKMAGSMKGTQIAAAVQRQKLVGFDPENFHRSPDRLR